MEDGPNFCGLLRISELNANLRKNVDLIHPFVFEIEPFLKRRPKIEKKNCGNYKFRLEFLHLLAGIQQLDLNLEKKVQSTYLLQIF